MAHLSGLRQRVPNLKLLSFTHWFNPSEEDSQHEHVRITIRGILDTDFADIETEYVLKS